jgi:hypothetical protein
MNIHRHIIGIVTQTFNPKTGFVSQAFERISIVPEWYTDANKDLVTPGKRSPIMQKDLEIELVQPIEPGEHVFNHETGRCIRCNCDEDDAYVGGEDCVGNGNVHDRGSKSPE